MIDHPAAYDPRAYPDAGASIVYAIIHERRVRYVGVTTKPLAERLRHHVGGDVRGGEWYRFTRGLGPAALSIVALEHVPDSVRLIDVPQATWKIPRPAAKAMEREAWWIAHMRQHRQPLLNRYASS